MRGRDLLECIEQIDDALVEEAMDPVVFPHRGIYRFGGGNVAKWGMVAACVVVLGVSATAIWSHQNIRDRQLEWTGDTAGYPMAMNSTAEDSASGTGSSQDSSLTAGAITEDEIEVDGSDNDSVREGGTSGESDDTLRQDAISGNSADSGRQGSVEDAALRKQSTEVSDEEKRMTDQAMAESSEQQYTIISDYYGDKDESVYDYPVPEKGEIICYHYLQETIKYYAELENLAAGANDTARLVYAYNIVIDVYGDVEMEGGQEIHYEELNREDTTVRNGMIAREYERLAGLGYAVQLAEDMRLTGILTKQEIDTFQTSPEYGYVFRLADEY